MFASGPPSIRFTKAITVPKVNLSQISVKINGVPSPVNAKTEKGVLPGAPTLTFEGAPPDSPPEGRSYSYAGYQAAPAVDPIELRHAPRVQYIDTQAPPDRVPVAPYEAYVSAGLSPLTEVDLGMISRYELTEAELLSFVPDIIETLDVELPPTELTEFEFADSLGRPDVERLVSSLIAWVSKAKDKAGSISAEPEYERSRTYAERDLAFAIHDAYAKSASRGFAAPTPMTMRSVSELVQADARKQTELRNAAKEDAYKRTYEMLSRAIEYRLQVEAVVFKSAVLTQKENIQLLAKDVKSMLAPYKLLAQQYNAQIDLFKEIVGAYRAYVRAVTAQGEAKIKELASYKAVLETSSADVNMYAAQLKLLKAGTEASAHYAEAEVLKLKEYEENVKILKINSQILKTNLDGAKQLLAATKEKIGLDKAALKAYSDTVEAELNQVGVYQQGIKLYSALNGTYSTAVDLTANEVEQAISLFKDQTRTTDAYVSAARNYANSGAAVANQLSSLVSRYGQAVGAYASTTESANMALKAEAIARSEAAIDDVAEQLHEAVVQGTVDLDNFKAIVAQAEAEVSAAAGIAQAAGAMKTFTARVSDGGSYSSSGSMNYSSNWTEEGVRAFSLDRKRESEAA